MRLLTVILALSLLSGCGVSQAELAQRDADKCQGYGFRPGTESYANCLMRIDQQRQRLIAETLGDMANQSRPVSCTSVGWSTTCY